MSISANFPNLQPSLLLDFANTKQLDNRVTFTRTTPAVYYDGKSTAVADQNLILQSQTLDVGPWTGESVTANTATAPDGTVTAETYNQGTGTTYHERYQSVVLTAGQTYTVSVYAKNVDGTYLNMTMYSAANVYAAAIFNISTGAVTTSGAVNWALVSSNITSVGNSWYRCSITFAVTTLVNLPTLSLVVPNTTTIGDYGLTGVFTGASKQIYLWGCQLEQRSTATAYTVTTTQPITNYVPVLLTAGVNQPRFDHNPTTGESLGLLIEEQRTNVLSYSSDLNNAYWNNYEQNLTSNTIIAPDGTLTGDKLAANTVNTVHYSYPASGISVSAGIYTASIYAKAGERSRLIAAIWGGSDYAMAQFDLANGTILQEASAGMASITPVGNGWYRCTVNRTIGAVTTYFSFGPYINGTFGPLTGAFPSYAGDGFSGIYVWGAQLEAANFATSYIATTSASATRTADDASMAGANLNSWFQPQQGSLYFESSYLKSGTRSPFQFGSSIGNRYSFYTSDATLNYFDGGVPFSTSFPNTSNKVACSLVNYDIAVAFNNATASSIPSGKALLNVDKFTIGSAYYGGEYICGTIKKMAYYPARLTNTQLQALTS